MLRQTLQLFVVVAGMAFAIGSHAQERDWNVASDAKREAKVVARYRHLLLRNPDHGLVYRSLIGKLGRGPALDRFIADIRGVASTTKESEPWILLGHLERDRGHDQASHAAYEQAVAHEPSNPAAHAALGASFDRSGHAQAADGAFERALALTTKKAARTQLLRRLADLAAARADHQRAGQWMTALVDASPKSYVLRIELAETQLRAHRFDAALKTFQVALELARRDGKRRAQVLLDIGNLHQRMHNPVAAEKAYRTALSIVGRSSWMRREVLVRLVDTARELQTLPAMVEELRREWSSPSYHDSLVLAGLAEELGDDEEAVRWLKRAARLDRRAIEPRTRLIAHLDHTRDAAKVKALYDEIVAIRPDDFVQRLERIEWLFFRGERPGEAMEQLRAAQVEVADDPTSLVEVAATWQRFGMLDAAIRVHENLEQSHPTDALHLETYGELLSRLGRRDDADAMWQRLFSLDSDGLRSRLRVAQIASRLDDHALACELLVWVLERAPRLADARQRLASAYEAREMWTEALQQWEILFFEDRADHVARRIVNIAERTVFIGDEALTPDESLLTRWEAHYQRLSSPRVGVVLARLRAAQGQPARALDLARAIAATDPTTLDTEQHLAWVDAAELVVDATRDTKPLEAISTLERIAAFFGDRRTHAWRRLVDLALHLPDEAEREKLLERALAAVPNDPHVHAVAGVYWGTTDSARAINHFQRAIALGTPSLVVYFDLATHLTFADRIDEAREVYLNVMRVDSSGSWAAGAAFSAIDLCRSDDDLAQLEGELSGLRGRVPEPSFHAIAVAIYHALFVYADDPEAAFARFGEQALPRLVAAIQTESWEDRAHAMKLVQLYPDEQVARQALALWPEDARTWSASMILTLGRAGTRHAGAALVDALEVDDTEARSTAIFAAGLARVEAAAKPLSARLASAALDDFDLPIIAAALGRIATPEAIRGLEQLAARGAEQQLLVTWALGQGEGDATAAALAKRLDDGSERVRKLAGVMLSHLDGAAGLHSLLVAAWDADPVRRAVADFGLRSAGIGDPVWDPSDTEARLSETLEQAMQRALSARPARPVANAFVGREQVVVSTATHALRESNARVLEHLAGAASEAETFDDEFAASLRRIVVGLRPRLRRLVRSGDVRTVTSAALLLPLAAHADDAALVVEAASVLPGAEASRVISGLARFPWPNVRRTLLDDLQSPTSPRRAASIRVLARTTGARDDAEALAIVDRLARTGTGDVQAAAVEALGALKIETSAEMLAELYDDAPGQTQRAIRASLAQLTSAEARHISRDLTIRTTKPVCDGNPEDLGDLLSDECVGAVEIPDF